jgi:hypothetical protein
MFVDVLQHSNGTETRWIAESGVLDLWLFLGPGPAEVRAWPTQLVSEWEVQFRLMALPHFSWTWCNTPRLETSMPIRGSSQDIYI